MAVDTNLLLRASRCIDSCMPDGAKLAGIIYQLDQLAIGLGVGVDETVISTTVVTSANPAVPVVLGLAGVTFKRVVFWGRNAARTDNTGDVWVQFAAADGSPGIKIGPGEPQTFEAPQNRILNASQFYIDVENANDGVLAIMFS